MLMFYTVYLILFVFLCTDFRPKHLCKLRIKTVTNTNLVATMVITTD